MTHCLIYKITNTSNGKAYIGQTWQLSLRTRLLQHCKQEHNNCLALRRAIHKYGRAAFRIELLTIAHTQETADHWERYFIKAHKTLGRSGYNLTEGGSNRRLTEATKRKISASKKGVKQTPEHTRANGLAKLGKRHSDATKRKMSASQIGKHNKPNGLKGKTWKLIDGVRVWHDHH